jgi:hypothetical protein
MEEESSLVTTTFSFELTEDGIDNRAIRAIWWNVLVSLRPEGVWHEMSRFALWTVGAEHPVLLDQPAELREWLSEADYDRVMDGYHDYGLELAEAREGLMVTDGIDKVNDRPRPLPVRAAREASTNRSCHGGFSLRVVVMVTSPGTRSTHRPAIRPSLLSRQASKVYRQS